ncbi:aldehyde dehydrogenase family protein [Maribacter sp. 2-571]|uniref:aldehyde dehydrogenase family protein n=1 Tax=Maribacter sp. 2-571 TaxID=3417569 RepID=UPI003D34448F
MSTSENPTLQPRTQAFLKGPQKMLIDGEWAVSENEAVFESIDPGTGKVLTHIPLAGAKDIDKTVLAAQKAFSGTWKSSPPAQRSLLMWKLADLIERDIQIFMELETLDNGKPIGKAEYDVKSTIAHFRYYAGWATKITGSTLPSAENQLVYTKREPLGVVGLIVPWNFPLMMCAWKLAPALACGNCCILKPAEQTSLTALYLGKLIIEAGFPKGVVNIVTGPGDPTGEALVRHPGIHKISFTGSTAVGKNIMQKAAQSNLKSVSLELGGKSPNVIFADAPMDKVSKALHWTSFYNSGQECTLGSRIYIQKEAFQQVVDGLIEETKKLQMDIGLKDPDLGPLISQQQLDRVTKAIKTGNEEGGDLVLGGERFTVPHLQNGYFLEPTIFVHNNDSLQLVQEEIFGPVVVVSAFDSFEEVLARANNSDYGLAAAVWTTDSSKALRFADQMDAGTVWINGYDQFDPAVPFGGFKQSGIGKEMGESALQLYTKEKAVWFNY